MKGTPLLGEPVDRSVAVLDDEAGRRGIVEAGAGDHGVLDVGVDRVERVDNSGDAALGA